MDSKADITIPLLPGCAYHVFNRGNEKRPIFFQDDNYAHFLKRFREYTEGYIDTYAYCLIENHFHFCLNVKSVKDILTKSLTESKLKLNRNFLKNHVRDYIESISEGNKLNDDMLVHNEVDKYVLPELKNKSSDYFKSEVAHRALVRHVLLEYEKKVQLPIRFENHPLQIEGLPFAVQLCAYLISQRMQRFFLSYAKFINKQQNRTGSLFQKCFHRKYLSTEGDVRTVISYIHHNVLHHECGKTYEDYEWSSYRDYVAREKSAITDEKVLTKIYHGIDDFVEYTEGYRQYRKEIEHRMVKYKTMAELSRLSKVYPYKNTGLLAQLAHKSSAKPKEPDQLKE